MKIYAIVLNYRHYRDTASCVRAILKSDFPRDGKIIIVDNSHDRNGQKDLRHEFGQKIKLMINKKNLGFAGGNNVAIKSAIRNGADWILIINPDVLIPRKFFGPLLKAAKETQAQIVAPAIRHRAGNKTLFGLEGKVDWHLAKPEHINLKRKPGNKIRAAQFVTFACILIRADTFQKIGLLDENYFMYLEDVDFCLRAKKAKQKVICVPEVVVDHETSSSFSNPIQKLPISFKSHLYFIHKWLPLERQIIPLIYTLLFYPYLFLLWSLQDLKRNQLKL